MLNVRKRSGKLEAFEASKITSGCKKAGASSKEAAKVAKDVSKKVAKMSVVPAAKLSSMVVASLKKVNKSAASSFVKYRDKKLKGQKKKSFW